MPFFIFILWILLIIAFWKIFEKANKPGWASIIPIYNIIILCEIAQKPWWWILVIMFIPIANIIFLIMMQDALSTRFGKGIGFTIGLILLPSIFYIILGFDNSIYTPIKNNN